MEIHTPQLNFYQQTLSSIQMLTTQANRIKFACLNIQRFLLPQLWESKNQLHPYLPSELELMRRIKMQNAK